jgi:hypothetical protein
VVALGGCTALLLLLIGWGDAAYWYHGADEAAHTSSTRVVTTATHIGTRAIVLDTQPGDARQLINPLLGTQVQGAAGQTITIGGWLWADQPAMSAASGVMVKTPDMIFAQWITRPIQLSATPTFVAWTFDVPQKAFLLQYLLVAGSPADAAVPAQLYLDGALIVVGSYPIDQAPSFDDGSARSGVWGGRRFTNLLRNGSAEDSWPH